MLHAESWLKMDPKVRLSCVPFLPERFVPDGDASFATAWQTAEWVAKYTRAKGRGFYLIQHLETWNGPADTSVRNMEGSATKDCPLKMVSRSRPSLGEDAVVIPYGLDIENFKW